MGTFIWCEIGCDKCSRESPGEWAAGESIPREKLISNALKNGWTFNSAGDSYCDECSKARSES